MPVKSLLADYAANYGHKLKAALGFAPEPQQPSALAPPPPNTTPIPNVPSGEGPDTIADTYVDPEEPGSAMEPMPVDGRTRDLGGGTDGMDAVAAQPPSALEDGGEGGGYSFRQAFKDAPPDAQKQQVTKLEETLKRGNQTIDSAYDDMVKQLGAPPEKNKKLSREEKGMLLMEFGMAMLANSRKGFATAAGEAGSQTLGSYAQMTQGPGQQYTANRAAIEGARARDKSKLATQSALESVKTPGGAASRLPGKFTGEDGYVYFYDESGNAKKALDDAGKPIKGDVSGGASARGFESDSKYARYMEIYGVNPVDGKPLTGVELARVKRDALDFANDRGSSTDDLDLDMRAETSADAEMRADTYQDMSPDEREAQRNRIADARRKRLVRPQQRHSALGGRTEPGRGGPRGPKKRFNSEADAKAAFLRGEIAVGDTIIVNGVEGPVE